MPQIGRCFDNAQTANTLAPLPQGLDGFDDVIHVTLRVDPPWNRESNEVEAGSMFLARMRIEPEHHCADFRAAHARFAVELDRKSLSRVLQWVYVWKEAPRVEVNRVTACGPDNRDTCVVQVLNNVTR